MPNERTSTDLSRDLEVYAQSNSPFLPDNYQADMRGLALPDWAEGRAAAMEDPKHRLAGWLCLYDFCRKAGDLTRAECYFQKAEGLLDIIEKPDWRDTQLKAFIYHRLQRGELQEALEACERMQAGPKKVDGLLHLADHAKTSGDEAQAHRFFRMAKDLAGTLPDLKGAFDAWMILGWQSLRAGDPEEARSDFLLAQEALLKIGKPGGGRQSKLAFAWKELGDLDAADAIEREITDPRTLSSQLTDAAHRAWLQKEHDASRTHLIRLLEVLKSMRGTVKKGELLASLVYTAAQCDQEDIARNALESIQDPGHRVQGLLFLSWATKDRSRAFQALADRAKREAEALPEGSLRISFLDQCSRLTEDFVATPEEEVFLRDLARAMRGEELPESSDG